MERRDISRFLIGSLAGTVLLGQKAKAQSCVSPCFAQTDAESAANVTPIHFEYLPGDVRRYGAVADDSTDCTAAIQAAINQANYDSGAPVYLPAGILRFSDTLVIDGEHAIEFCGAGAQEHYGVLSPPNSRTTILRKNGNFDGIHIGSASYAPTPFLHDFSMDSLGGSDSSRGVVVTKARGTFRMQKVIIQYQGSHGIHILHNNLGTYDGVKCMSNGGDGFRIEGTPSPDTNACVFNNLDLRGNTGWGMNIVSGWANFGIGITAQSNVAGGVRLNNARQNHLQVYSEANGGPELEFVDSANCKGNFVVLLEGFATFGGTTENRNTVLNMKRGAEFDPNYSKVTANRFILPNLQNNDADASSPLTVTGVLEIKHVANATYEFAHSANDVDCRSTFTHQNPSFKHRVDADALLLRKAASNCNAGEIMFGSTTATTVGAAGGASALPATPVGYIIVNVAGSQRKIPFYAT
jgi:hypothetical protein